MKTIKQIYDIVIESLVTEKLLNRDIEQRIKTDKSYNPVALNFYKFLKTKNVTYQFYHGTSGVAWEMMKKDGYIISPFLRGTGEFEARKGSGVKEKGINQIYFTTDYDYAETYADRECKKFKDVKNFKDFINIAKSKYKFSDEFIKENNTPIVLKIIIPLYLLTEVVQCIYSEDYRNESGMNRKITRIILNKDTNNEEKLKNLIKYINNIKNNTENNEFTVIGLLPISRVKGFEMVRILNKDDEATQILIYAAKDGDLTKVKECIKNGADIHANDEEALIEAAINGHLKIVKFLVENGADIHADNNMALRTSLYNDNLEVAKFLLEKGADIHADNDYIYNYVFNNNDIKLLNFFKENNIIFDDKIKYSKLFLKACENGDLEKVKEYIEKGADIHTQNDDALRSAASGGHISIVKYLIEKGVNIHAKDDFALIAAAQKGHFEVVKYLVEHGADIHAEDDEALRNATINGHLKVVKYLIEKGANIHAEKDEAFKSAINAIKYSTDTNRLEIIKCFLEKGADVSKIDLTNVKDEHFKEFIKQKQEELKNK